MEAKKGAKSGGKGGIFVFVVVLAVSLCSTAQGGTGINVVNPSFEYNINGVQITEQTYIGHLQGWTLRDNTGWAGNWWYADDEWEWAEGYEAADGNVSIFNVTSDEPEDPNTSCQLFQILADPNAVISAGRRYTLKFNAIRLSTGDNPTVYGALFYSLGGVNVVPANDVILASKEAVLTSAPWGEAGASWEEVELSFAVDAGAGSIGETLGVKLSIPVHDPWLSGYQVVMDNVRVEWDRVTNAYDPYPADGATGVEPDVMLSWSAGKGATSHNVYFGTDFDDVNGADTSDVVFRGNQHVMDVNYEPGNLDLLCTYYWRIDEVNGPSTVKGDIWSFTTRGGGVIPGLIAQWTFDEGTGTTAYDSAGDNDGTFVGDPCWTSGRIDGALEFDGVDDYVDVPYDHSLNVTANGDPDFAVEAWINVALFPSGTVGDIARYILYRGVQPSKYQFALHIYKDTNYFNIISFAIGAPGGGGTGTTSPTLQVNRWYHVVGTYDGYNIFLYLNGEEVYWNYRNYTSQGVWEGSAPLYIGTKVNKEFFNGIIDEVAVYNRALSAAEVQALYQGSLGNTAPIACIVDGDRVVEAGGGCEAVVVLDSSYSSDADSTEGTNDDINDFDWYEVIDACEPNSDIYIGSGEVIECNLGLGEHVIVLEVTDKAGAFDSNEVVITVVDVMRPVITLNGAETVVLECGMGSYAEEGATAHDNCDEAVTVAIGGDTVDTSTCGTYVVTYDATDGSGNTAEQVTRTVIVDDTLGPVIALNGSETVILECGVDSYVEEGATATDNCDEDVAVVIGGDLVDTLACGTYVVTYDATDSWGSEAEQVVRTVVVEDTTPPELSLVVEPNVLWPPNGKMVEVRPEWEVSDNCDEEVEVSLVDISMNVEGDINDYVRIGDDGSIYLRAAKSKRGSGRIYTLRYEAVDDSGNVTEASATVTVPHSRKVWRPGRVLVRRPGKQVYRKAMKRR